jgi:site-specific recombinase XerD
MFERLFRYPSVLARHRQGPLAEDREEFLQRCADQGMAHGTLLRIARELLVIARQIDAVAEALVTPRQIELAADRWARRQRRRGRSTGSRWSRELFVNVATNWLRFLGRLETTEPVRSAHRPLIESFAADLLEARGLSAYTIRARCWHTEAFLTWLSAQNRSMAAVTLEDVDAFLQRRGQDGWCRVSVAACAGALRSFFRYAEQRGRCTVGLAAGIAGPRVFKEEGVPVGPDWADVQRLIGDACGERARDIRDRAILMLFALYGFRSGEVAGLRLDDVNWAQDRIELSRPKQRRHQVYPLLPSVGEAILRYVQQTRPRSACREIFLTLRAPFRPLTAGGLYHVVSSRLNALGIRSLRRGPHALRHACAGRLVAQGLSLKEIGDHLGHHSAYTTRIYAKVDLGGLREVAQFSLGGLL